MDTELLLAKFRRIGARAKVGVDRAVGRVSIDVRADARGGHFDVKVGRAGGVAVDAIDVRPRDRHLLLAVRDEDRLGVAVGGGQRFLCGHDERAWFVAVVPEGRPASNVDQAKDALKPQPVRWAEQGARLRFGRRHDRRNAAWVRQGEWFFVPVRQPWLDERRVLRDEPLVRTGGKPHRAEFCYRDGGEEVYVHRVTGRVVSVERYRQLLRDKPGGVASYLPQRRNMSVFVRGRVSHPDHKTIVLRDWHQVFMNTEHQSTAMRYVAFID